MERKELDAMELDLSEIRADVDLNNKEEMKRYFANNFFPEDVENEIE